MSCCVMSAVSAIPFIECAANNFAGEELSVCHQNSTCWAAVTLVVTAGKTTTYGFLVVGLLTIILSWMLIVRSIHSLRQIDTQRGDRLVRIAILIYLVLLAPSVVAILSSIDDHNSAAYRVGLATAIGVVMSYLFGLLQA